MNDVEEKVVKPLFQVSEFKKLLGNKEIVAVGMQYGKPVYVMFEGKENEPKLVEAYAELKAIEFTELENYLRDYFNIKPEVNDLYITGDKGLEKLLIISEVLCEAGRLIIYRRFN